MAPISTRFTQATGATHPLIAAPMFLVSNVDMVVEASNAGALGATPSLNWRTPEQFRAAIREIKSRTDKPYAVNLIVNASSPRHEPDLQICVEEKVPVVITSLGNPKEAIKRMHAVGSKVFCDVVDLKYALKVQDLGADGVIAVSTGAGGHPGPISPLVLVPYLRKHLSIPIVLAGGIAQGSQIAAALALGADAVQVGTRFIASTEAAVDESYKKAILDSDPEDIVLTQKISGTDLSVIKTPYVEKMGYQVNAFEKLFSKNPKFKKYIKMARIYLGSQALEKASRGPTYKEVWCAGQGVGLIENILPTRQIIENLMRETQAALTGLSKL